MMTGGGGDVEAEVALPSGSSVNVSHVSVVAWDPESDETYEVARLSGRTVTVSARRTANKTGARIYVNELKPGMRFKQFDEGIRQLEEEGLMQVLFPMAGRREPILGTVGPLQLEVVAARLRGQITWRATWSRCPIPARWVVGKPDKVAAATGRRPACARPPTATGGP
jgi:hypothetical protein